MQVSPLGLINGWLRALLAFGAQYAHAARRQVADDAVGGGLQVFAAHEVAQPNLAVIAEQGERHGEVAGTV